jgi:hypothetical protein
VGDVVPLNDNVLAPGVEAKRVIELLEETLAEARRGEIAAISFAAVAPNGEPRTGWSWDDLNLFWPLLAATTRLTHRLQTRVDTGA